MLIIPRSIRNTNDTYGSGYFGTLKVSVDNTKQMSEIEKKYAPYIAKMNTLVKEIDTEIKKSERRAKEILEAFPKKVEIETESTKNRVSLYTTKMNALKTIMGAIKEIKETEMKEQKMVYDMTGKNVDIKGGNVNMKANIASLYDSNITAAPRTIHSLQGYGKPIPSSNGEFVPNPTTSSQNVDNSDMVEEGAMDDNYTRDVKTDGAFTSLFGKVETPDSSKYIQGNNTMKDYEKVDNRFSYGAAQTGLKAKYLEDTEVKCHWDDEEKIGWLRTYSKDTGNIVSEEAFISPAYHGVLNKMVSGGLTYAISETDDTYSIVPDKVDNAPKAIVDDLLETYKRQDLRDRLKK